jgi:hypothetical protein
VIAELSHLCAGVYAALFGLIAASLDVIFAALVLRFAFRKSS